MSFIFEKDRKTSLTPSSSSYSKLDTDESLENSSLSSLNQKVSKTPKRSNYGSLRTETKQTANAFIVNHKHKINPGETLQGISLKYGVPIENIKRANRLWSNDLAFVKEHLIVPMSREKLQELNIDFEDSVNVNDVKFNLSENNNHNHHNGQTENKKSEMDSSVESSDEQNSAQLKDYLNRFDSFLNESKMKLKNLETNSNLTLNDYFNNNNSMKKKQSSFNESLSSKNDSFNEYVICDESLNEDDLDLFNAKTHKSKSTSRADASEPFIQKSSANASFNSSEQMNRSSSSNKISSNGSLSSAAELSITSPNKYTNYYNANHNIISSTAISSRARIAQENLQRLEREKDDLYEL